MSYSSTTTETYSVTDIEIVMRRVTTDLVMIAGSTGAVTEDRARDLGHDIEALAKSGYLKAVDLTLLSAGTEVKAARYDVNTESGTLTTSRPGGVLWPKVSQPELRIIVFHTDTYNSDAKEKMAKKLRISWSPSKADTSHSILQCNSGRNYVSNGYGMLRKDFTQ